MIRRPPKRIGGAIGMEFDALWEAIGQQAITDGSGVQVDRTTRGTVLRPRPQGEETRIAFFALDQQSAFTGEPAQCRRVLSFQGITGGALTSNPTLDAEVEEVLHVAKPRTWRDIFLAVNVLVGVPAVNNDGHPVMIEEYRWIDAAYAPQYFNGP